MLLSFKLHFPLDYSLAYLFKIDPLLFRCAKKYLVVQLPY